MNELLMRVKIRIFYFFNIIENVLNGQFFKNLRNQLLDILKYDFSKGSILLESRY